MQKSSSEVAEEADQQMALVEMSVAELSRGLAEVAAQLRRRQRACDDSEDEEEGAVKVVPHTSDGQDDAPAGLPGQLAFGRVEHHVMEPTGTET